jgi:CMP-N,N'-diacetyllegionaminic acid synthase
VHSIGKTQKIIAIIPARGGSKGLPGKNTVLLMGKPLICYTIEAAKKSKYVKLVVVSTDDKEIAKVAKITGAEVPFLRPAELAKDETPSLPVIQHAVKCIEELNRCIFDLVVVLQPTSPLRTEKIIDDAVEKVLNTEADSVVTVCKVDHNPYWSFVISKGKLKPFIVNKKAITKRQDLPDVYALNGAVYVVRRDVLFEQNTILGKDTRPLIMPIEESIDIDNYFDLFLTEMIINYWAGWINEKCNLRK